MRAVRDGHFSLYFADGRQLNRGLRRCARLTDDGLINGHQLRALIEPRHGCKISVLSGHQHLPREMVVFERLNGPARSPIVRRQDCRQWRLEIVQRLCHQNVSLRGAPLGNPDVGKNLDIAAVDQRLQYFHLSRTNNFGIRIEWRTTHQNVIPFRRVLRQTLRLKYAHGKQVESYVEIHMRIVYEAIVADDWNMFGVGRFNDATCLLEVVWQEHQHIDARGQEIFDLLELQIVVAIGRSRDGLCAKLLSAQLKFIDVRLPTLTLGVLEG